MRYKDIECPSITDKGICLLDRQPCVCVNWYCFCSFPHKHLKEDKKEKEN